MYLYLGAVFLFLLAAALPWKIDVTKVQIKTDKVKNPMRIMVLADLHCRRFGKNQNRILDRVKEEKPDIIVIPGDLFDYERDYEVSFELIRGLKGYPVYFSSGNHEMFLSDDLGRLRRRLEHEGVYVLEDRSEVFHEAEIAGMTDMGERPVKSPTEVSALFQTNLFRILISHRPHYYDLYRSCRCDLIISGHYHGGQWCLPFTKKGIYVPHEGFFPSHTHGLHEMNGKLMFVSRGLASGHPNLPRLYNNPEIGIIDIIPENPIK